jgi:hypothetical protein
MTDKPKANDPIIIALAITEVEGSPGLYTVFGVGATKDGMLRVGAAADEYQRKLDQARAEAARSAKPPTEGA